MKKIRETRLTLKLGVAEEFNKRVRQEINAANRRERAAEQELIPLLRQWKLRQIVARGK
ncbi:MAG: hypothetical protein Q8R12_01575 [bacterium]|nr:hypothetical protein [bacterium]